MKYVGLVLLGILLIILLLLLIAIVRTLLMPNKTSDYKPEAEEKEALRLAEKLSRWYSVTQPHMPERRK